jgi:hypothetical protein
MIGDAGKRLHTGRSRNDQVAVDIRMYIIDESAEIDSLLKKLLHALIELAERNSGVIMPVIHTCRWRSPCVSVIICWLMRGSLYVTGKDSRQQLMHAAASLSVPARLQALII